MEIFLFGNKSPSVSRVLSRMVIYLAFELLRKSSGYRILAGNQAFMAKFSLQPTGFTSHFASLRMTVSSYLTHFTLTKNGGIVSVALSLRFLSVAVSNCRSLYCPDFPLKNQRPFNGLLKLYHLFQRNAIFA